ncbi:sterol desaturase family protein [Synechococcus sp. 1G10]|uniref:sterol desaturase family protein n=1 Tax=Synechococcus sp. 1G10 TaxID=2025605 RepID=UPI00130333CD|nr:sterol desaturase family protein [Synechococcus sp. 1G10]
MEFARWFVLFIAALLAWTGLAYALHRLAHHDGRLNLLHSLHRAHHAPGYLLQPRILRWHHLLFWFDTSAETLDVWITLTLPALLIAALLPAQGPALLGLHYLYEILLSDQRFDHNPAIGGSITRVLACGTYHLQHHSNPSRHFGLILTLWDHIFGSAADGRERTPRLGS